MEQWSNIDNVCQVEYHPGWELNRWVSALRAETIRVCSNNVVLYLEETSRVHDVPPLKNKLQAICEVLRQHRKGVKIFIANLLPKPSSSPVCHARMESDFILLQAIRGVNRSIKKVHYLSIFEHFVARKSGRIIRPTHKYFQENSELTRLSCLIFCECLMREIGIKNYWFV